MEKHLFLIITRTQTPLIEKRIRSLVNAGIDAYAVVDNEPVSGKRFLTIPDHEMDTLGWTNHMSRNKHRITAWDKATYIAFKSGKKYVWFCEDDVFWNKVSIIKHIINTQSNADLIAYPLAKTYSEDPDWLHWGKVELLTTQKKYWTATFNQLCRLSQRVLQQMHELSITKKRLFFHEGMFATICNMNRYQIQYLPDIIDPDIFINIRWDKPYKADEIKELIKEHTNILLHPVKVLP
jgi:hypothetical protein